MIFIVHSKKYGPHKVEIDDEDAERVSRYTWYVSYVRRKGKFSLKYVRTNIRKDNGKQTALYLHRFVLQHKKINEKDEIDHIDNNRLNNKKSNLRVCSRSENACNCYISAYNTTGFKGVSWKKSHNKYEVQIMFHRKAHWIGLFCTKEEAARAYNEAAKQLHGEFAKLNAV